MDRIEQLCAWLHETLGYTPRDGGLFERALTHRSAGTPNNERLEFLGDAVLGLITAQYLCEQFEAADEGQLSRLRARIVSGESLAQVAATLGLSEWLLLGPGEHKSGGAARRSILADALEALCGAIYLEGGLAATRAVFLRVLAPALQLDSELSLKDPKTRLQELLQARGLALPRYQVQAVEGALHAQVFRVTCEVRPLAASASATGSSRRRAEQAAAALVLAQIGES